MNRSETGYLAPWVLRVVFANAVALVVLKAVLTAPGVAAALRFDPAGGLTGRGYAALTYSFVHESAIHLGLTSLLILSVGPALERRLGGRGFVLYYLYCGIGAALASVAVAQLLPVPPMSGALAAGLGLLFGYAWLAPDREVSLNPVPLRARVQVLAVCFTAAILVLGALARTPGLSVAHLGGVAAGWLFFRLYSLGKRPDPALPLPIRRPVLAPMQVQQADRPAPAASSPIPTSMGVEDAAQAVNRVLDKINATGLESLTPQERRILTEYAERKRERSQ
jgi:membrane associated rhomboid family serine protease